MSQHSSADKATIAHFAKDSSQWWDENGPFAPLHRLNPTRLQFITSEIAALTGRDMAKDKPFKGLEVLDIGCGGGLTCEPLARLGANMTGLDADGNAIQTAQAHADTQGLKVNYVHGMPENLGDKRFDVVLALEVIEHVTNPADFIATCHRLLKPNGVLICSTLNRTPSSYLLGIIAAEHILRWVPKNTHQWRAFIKPSELTRFARAHGLNSKRINGIIFNPLKGEFNLSDKDFRVNYIAAYQGPVRA